MSDQSTRHSCNGELPEEGYGEAIYACSENERGELWVGNSEYGSQVNFCPYCGYKAPTQLHLIMEINHWNKQPEPRWVPEAAASTALPG